MQKLAISLSLTAALLAPALAAQERAPDRDALAARIAELETTIEKLAAVVEGTAKPVNLARTSLATVSASSVNGGRALSNGFYGIRNAFDDGDNAINGLSYTYWLASGEPSPWVKIWFEAPVSLASLFIEGGPAFTTRLTYEKGGEQDFPSTSGELKFTALEHGVRSVRLRFAGGGNVRVDEIRLMGHAPGAATEVCTPAIAMDRHQALMAAKAAFTEWRTEQLAAQPAGQVEETEAGYEVTLRANGIAVLRVTVDRRTGEAKCVPLARWVPLSSPRDR